jgi:(2Fe-2S) ferredoxin
MEWTHNLGLPEYRIPGRIAACCTKEIIWTYKSCIGYSTVGFRNVEKVVERLLEFQARSSQYHDKEYPNLKAVKN